MTTAADSVRLGDAEISRVVEWIGPISSVDTLFPDTPAGEWTADLAPDHWVPDTRAYRAAMQTWVVRTDDLLMVIDTGVGNGRDRPQVPTLANLDTDFLDRLTAAGVRPDDVDVVVNTHVHYDHVGWNTRLEAGRWVPTFPNATYLVPEADYEYFRPENAHRMRAPQTEDERARFDGIRLVFADSISPVADAGQLRTVSGSHRIDDRLRIEPAPGHTPGSSVVWLDDAAVFVGDLIHTPVQVGRPADSCAFDLDADQARRSRRDLLRDAAQNRAIVFPAHFAGAGAFGVTGGSEGPPVIESWADLRSI